MQLRNKQDFWSGIMFVALGVGFALGATNYSMGTAARMGPGYFPFWLGVCLAGLGAIVALTALSPKAHETHVEKFDWKIAFVIVGAVALSGSVMDFLGVYISVFLLGRYQQFGKPRIQLEGCSRQWHIYGPVRLAGIHQGFRFDLPLVA